MIPIYKATGLRAGVPDLVLNIVETVPEQETLADSREFFRAQGRALAEALRTTLPGGTYDALLAELLETKLSLLRVVT